MRLVHASLEQRSILLCFPRGGWEKLEGLSVWTGGVFGGGETYDLGLCSVVRFESASCACDVFSWGLLLFTTHKHKRRFAFSIAFCLSLFSSSLPLLSPLFLTSEKSELEDGEGILTAIQLWVICCITGSSVGGN